ncbi:uncharacterized protein BDZ99DRAFT_446304 [Mytilinidion resinicola]|uniref:Tautomerase cis-CaaD-like domain-containing protein n=1 Tax=Mytilinidion resinicola TaxID=574789 RepID=A0A6A6YFK9_9PEZI|nr:uncharacterized protein BDZ99DRAFT_446304 [Mytilinidion resinicola]KAF2807582.1 hypothetical protein BDZ99DRAFT_446304 [Mytilinidion resinicola]
MPLWQIYHPPTTFTTPASRAPLAAALTALYTAIGLPAFYVVVLFHPLPDADTYVGGVAGADLARPFIRLVGNHVAVKMPDEDAYYAQFCGRLNEALKPHIEDKGYDWEYHVDETERRLWRIQGLYPPPHGSEEEKGWVQENKASVWEEMKV